MELQKLITESKNLDPMSSTVVSKLVPTRAFSVRTIGKWLKIFFNSPILWPILATIFAILKILRQNSG